MRQQFLNISTEELRALHGDKYLEIVTATRARIQKMNPKSVAEAINRTLQCVLDFVSGTTRVPRASTLSAMLEHITAAEGVVKPVQPELQRRIIRVRRDLRKNPRHKRLIGRLEKLRAGKRS